MLDERPRQARSTEGCHVSVFAKSCRLPCASASEATATPISSPTVASLEGDRVRNSLQARHPCLFLLLRLFQIRGDLPGSMSGREAC